MQMAFFTESLSKPSPESGIKNICSLGTNPHERDGPVVTGWPADVCNRHANVYAKKHMSQPLRQLYNGTPKSTSPRGKEEGEGERGRRGGIET